MDAAQLAREKEKAVKWAREVLTKNPIIVDLETTGLRDAEIVQIGVIDIQGKALMDTLVKPIGHIPIEVTRIHGITDAMVADAPTFNDLYAQFSVLLAGKLVVTYNASYDKSVIVGECKRRKLPMPRARWSCAMEAYAQFWGEWSIHRRGFKWQKLVNACLQQHINLDNAHNAVADCRATLALIQIMAR